MFMNLLHWSSLEGTSSELKTKSDKDDFCTSSETCVRGMEFGSDIVYFEDCLNSHDYL